MKLLSSVLWMFIGSIIIGYCITSVVLVNSEKDIQNSLTKFYMAVHMALWMVIVEILMFSVMMKDYKMSLWIVPVAGLIVLFIYLLRDQIGVEDNNYLRAMIQHHSSAILTSKKILEKTTDENVKDLANQIIKSQEDEIIIMNNILKNN